ncbi:hypothetical protein ACQ4PT_061357 [Festuca glaucescens]
MTVGRGDAEGDLGSPPPAADLKGAGEACSPEWLSGSRFWALQLSDDEDQGETEEVPALADMNKVIRYLCRTPTQVCNRDIIDGSSELARRNLKRINRRDQQRAATKAAMVLSSPEGKGSMSPLSVDKSLGKTKKLSMPVMEPTVFVDDSTEGWTVIRRRRWLPAIGKTVHDPRSTDISNSSVLGLARLRANSKKYLDRHGPISEMFRRADVIRSNGDQEPRQVRVGNSIAGRAFRKILGLAWRKIESGEPVVRRQSPVITMNGDGGHGSFNPGRGGYGAGRGGYQGCGGFQGRGAFHGRGFQGRGDHAARGRGDYAVRGRQMGNAQGGHGYGAIRGGHHTNAASSGFSGGRNFTQGESSGTAAMGNTYHNASWNGANNGQRNNPYSAGNNFGYGGNQQRWQATRGGGFQQRARDNGAARTGIDADLLHQTVQAVVAAVTAATKTPDAQVAVRAEDVAGGTVQHAGTSVAAPNVIPQQTGIQEVQGPQIAGAKGKENEGQGPQKKKKEDKQGCFRCKQPGHYIDDCPTPFCDLCESVHHTASACHLLHVPKPTAIMHGYANEALMFFEFPCGAFKAKVDNPKLAKVIIDGDAMTIPKLIDQLKKIVPSDKFNWEVFHYKENIYRVKLPSKKEVQRLKNFGTYICTDREACLSFDIWLSLEEPLYTLPEVWVRVSGLPNDIRSDYLSLWGVGTLFGKTLDVDMAYTRNNKVLRTKIGCLDRNLILADSDVFIRRGFFKLHFEVETTNGSQEVNMSELNNGNDGNDDTCNVPENIPK